MRVAPDGVIPVTIDLAHVADELSIPQVPDAKPDDPEDVSWALSTAEAMWARGDHAEGIKWVRRAAEAASEAENDNRALELAKAAADLQGLIARMSVADKGSDRKLPAAPPPVPTKSGPPSVPPPNRSVPPIGRSAASGKPSAPPAGAKGSGRSVPPIPLPSKTSSPPPATTAPPTKASTAPRPLATANKPQGPKPAEKKGRRRSRENLEAEAKAAGVLQSAANAVLPSDTDEVAAIGSDDAIPLRPKVPNELDATVIAPREEIEKGRKTSRSAAEWDASPTANVAGDAIEEEDGGDRKTAIGAPPTARISVPPRAAPASIPPRAAPRTPSIVPHDPGIQTSQAIRVVVWRDASGVHVAPAGTPDASRVSAIKIDAMLVALDPTADLTAWLSQKTR